MKKVGLIFGGISSEHAVSIMSAKNIVNNIDRELFELILIYRDKNWYFYQVDNIERLNKLNQLQIGDFIETFDVALLMTHGKYGEDGVIQWILESQGVPYCGSRVLGSAVCMDKAVFRDIMSKFDIKQTRYGVIDFYKNTESEIEKIKQDCISRFNLPFYIKPANSGSSVGITKIDTIEDIELAIDEAKKYDSKVLIEEWLVDMQEIELAVVWNSELIISQPGELVLDKDFYSYEDKYELGQATVNIPAKIDDNFKNIIRNIVLRVYKITDCQWFARVDFFVKNGDIYVNEINTLPGFTDISMFPMLMKSMGIGYKELITRIIELGY